MWQSLPHGLDSTDIEFKDVSFINSTHGWIVGEDNSDKYGGVILQTNNSGNNWHLKLFNQSPYHEQIDIVNEQTIWVTGEGALYYSLDGGNIWNESAISGSAGLSFVKFMNQTHGWTASMGVLFATIDGGLNWQIVPGWSFSTDVPRDMHIITAEEIWAIGFFGIYYSVDGCETWTKEFDKGGWSLSFVDDTDGWAVSDRMIAHLGEQKIWSEISLPVGSVTSISYLTDVQFIDSETGWIVGGSSVQSFILYTPNGGQTWYEQQSPDGIFGRLIAVDFINRTHGWAVGHNGIIIRTTTGDSLGIPLVSDTIIWVILIALVIGIIVISSAICYYFIRRNKRIRDQLRAQHSPTVDKSMDL